MAHDTRPNYQRVLHERLHEAFGDTDCYGEALYEFVRDIALESFKNGKAAGMKAAQGPRRPAANIKGTALQNGKLRPVAQ